MSKGNRPRARRVVLLLAGIILLLFAVLGGIGYRFWTRPLGPALALATPVPSPTNAGSLATITAVTPTLTSGSPPQCGGPEVMYLLVVGADTSEDDDGFADAIRLARIDFTAPRATVLSIPRDLWVRIPGMEQYHIVENRLMAAYAYGNAYEVPGGGVNLLVQTLADNFGILVDHYVVIDFELFVDSVDTIGGIDIDVPEAIDGRWQKLPYFEVGHYHMDGGTALQYIRVRSNNTTDLDRIDRQTQVILAIREKVLSPQVLPMLPELTAAIQDRVLTDMSPSQLSAVVCIGQRLEAEQIQMASIDYSMTTSATTAWGYEVLWPDYDAILPFIERFNAGRVR
jgi:LCP family protein required for cell wall assembly